MDVYLLFHDTRTWDDASSDLVGIYGLPESAIKAYNFYLDRVENEWRVDETPDKNNTFNRFSEPVGETLTYARAERNDIGHYVYVLKRPLE
jgi:hypothetical protein